MKLFARGQTLPRPTLEVFCSDRPDHWPVRMPAPTRAQVSNPVRQPDFETALDCMSVEQAARYLAARPARLLNAERDLDDLIDLDTRTVRGVRLASVLAPARPGRSDRVRIRYADGDGTVCYVEAMTPAVHIVHFG